jgi:penicillin-binding protein 1A
VVLKAKNRSQLKYPTCLKFGASLSATAFLNTSGIDERNITSLQSLGTSGGASTLTQLAKQLFHGEGSKFCPLELYRKKEWIIAIRLERQYTKNEILRCTVMCMTWELFCGVSSAAQTYFQKNLRI